MSHERISAGSDRVRGPAVRARSTERVTAPVADVRARLASSGQLLGMQRLRGNRHVVGLLEAARDAEGKEGRRARRRGEELDLEQAIAAARSSGRPLEDQPRSRMEAALGADFGGVRVHTGPEADVLNVALGASAFTLGQDVFFRSGRYQPASREGTRLLAHELTHVVQQSGAPRAKLEIGEPGDRFEREADLVAEAVDRAETGPASAPRVVAQAGAAPARVQRQGGMLGAVRSALYDAHAWVPQHVRAGSTPKEMTQDRIPPRVDTSVFVGVFGLSALGSPVTFTVENQSPANGTLTIDGAATADRRIPGFLQLRGTTQTSPGSAARLQLVGKQGATELARSSGFSVSAIPQNWSVSFDKLVSNDPDEDPDDRGIVVKNSWESDSGNVADLTEAKRSETVEVKSASGCFNTVPSSQSTYKDAHTGRIWDVHASDRNGLTSTGSRVAQQCFMFKDNRTGADDIPATRSGFLITRVVTARPSVGGLAGSLLWLAGQSVQELLGKRGGFYLTISKTGHGGTANGVTSAAASGSVSGREVV